jgi:hypothetical protein
LIVSLHGLTQIEQPWSHDHPQDANMMSHPVENLGFTHRYGQAMLAMIGALA